jgi:hypothetical protein
LVLIGRIAALVGCLLLALPGFAARVPLRDGQEVALKLRNVLTTDNVQKGDTIQFEVAEDVLINGHVVIAKGATASGKILDVKGAFKPRAKDAEVIFQFAVVHASDGQDLPLRPQAGKPRKGAEKGNEIHERSEIPGQITRVVGAEKGKQYEAYVDGSFIITTSDTFTAAPAAAPSPAAAQPSASVAVPVAPPAPPSILTATDVAVEPSAVEFSSTPDRADIVIDGNLVGNTPSTLRLTPGHHTIEIRMAGYRTWTRVMVVDPESRPSVRATLVPN